MALLTRAQFYYGHTIRVTENGSLDFSEGGPELQATMSPGDYTLTTFVTELQTALNAAGALTYTVTVSRTTRRITIAASGPFELLFATGSRFGSSVASLAGFAALDYTGASSYLGPNGSGSVFRPQALFSNHTDAENFVERTDAVVNEAASGRVQVITFGTTKFHEFDIVLQTNKATSPVHQPQIENTGTGLTDVRDFMNYAVSKALFEYMPNRDAPSTYDSVILEQTPQSRSGTSFKLVELRGTNGYFSTGLIRLRVVEV